MSGSPSPAPSSTSRPPIGTTAVRLPTPDPGRWEAEAFVRHHLDHLVDRRDDPETRSSSVFRGGQRAADAALASFDVAGYGARADLAYPQRRRTVSALSPWVRHGLLTLGQLWDHVEGGPDQDVRAFRHQLLRQEYARHCYARLGGGRRRPAADAGRERERRSGDRAWDRRMGCVEIALDELEEDGWLVEGGRRWLARHRLTTDPASATPDARPGATTEAEEHFFRHLLDGSRAANGLGWASAARYPFSRWDVEQHAAGLCASCDLVSACPIERPRQPPAPEPTAAGSNLMPDSGLGLDAVAAAGPSVVTGPGSADAVWLTAESLGDADPALAAHPDLPAVFVFDEPLLARLRLSAKRLSFLTETVSDLATRRPVELWLGPPAEALARRSLAVTFTPVPGWRARSARLELASVHPWPWLRTPHGGDHSTFETWRRAAG